MSKLDRLKKRTKRLAPIFMAAAMAGGCTTMNISFDKVDTYVNGQTIPTGDLSHYEFKYQLYSSAKLQGYDMVKDGQIHNDLVGYYTDPEQNYADGIWNDLSGKGYDLQQIDPNMQPGNSSFGARRAVAFDGIDDYLEANVYAANDFNREDGFTVILVAQTTRQGEDPMPGTDFEGMVSIGEYRNYTNRGKVNIFHRAEEKDTVIDMSHGIGSSNDYRDTNGETFIYVVRGRENFGRKDAYLGLEQVNAYNSGRSERVQNQDLKLAIGGNMAYYDSRMQGKIASLAIYNTALDDERLLQAVSWTAQKYQLDTSKIFAKVLEPESIPYLPQQMIDDCAADSQCTMKDEFEMAEYCAEVLEEDYKEGVSRCFETQLPMLGQISGTAHDHTSGLSSEDSAPYHLQTTGKKLAREQILSLRDLEENYDGQNNRWLNTAPDTSTKFHASAPAECDMPEMDKINGRAALKFDGVNHCLHIPDLDGSEMTATDGYTYFMVVELPQNMSDPTPNSGFNAILAQGEYRNGVDRPNIFLNQTRNNPTELYDLSKGRGASVDAQDTGGVPVIISVTVEPNGGAKNVYMGQDLIASTTSTLPERVNVDNYHFYIGGEAGNDVRRMFGKVGAVEVYKKALSDKQREAVIDRLKTDFGITYDTPPMVDPQASATPLSNAFTLAQSEYKIKEVKINNDNQLSMKATYKPFG